MGTHPIFESDFDCLTEDGSTELIRWLIVGFGWWNEIEVDGNSGHCRTNKKGRKEKREKFEFDKSWTVRWYRVESGSNQ